MVALQSQLNYNNFKTKRIFEQTIIEDDLEIEPISQIKESDMDKLLAMERQYQGSIDQKLQDQIEIDVKPNMRPVSVRISAAKIIREETKEEAVEEPQTKWGRFTNYVTNKLCGTGKVPQKESEILKPMVADSQQRRTNSQKRRPLEDAERLLLMKQQQEREVRDSKSPVR